MSKKLLDTLHAITGTGQFHSVGSRAFFTPGLEIEGFGEVAFPLHPIMAKALKNEAEQAPYGKGQDTILDQSVRSCWQIDASGLTFTNPKWKKFISELTAQVATDLGVQGQVAADLYKLLLYEKGGHFLPHRDTEKLGRMFATLIIALPSAHQGGELLIRHEGKELSVDFSEAGSDIFSFAAFFADCEHEVRPVSDGYRCCLVYNLHLKKGNPAILNLSLTEHTRQLLPPLETLKSNLGSDLTAILLEHRYTEANLSLRQLKNNDRARGEALIAAATEAGLRAHLALVTFHQMGELEGGNHWNDRYSSSSEKETMGEVYEESLTIDHWRNAKDRKEPLGSWFVTSQKILATEEIGQGDPHEKIAEGYTGNAGCTMDYWYHRAAVVLWHPEAEEKLLVQYNLTEALARFHALSTRKNRPRRWKILGEAVIDAVEKKYQTYLGYSDWRDNDTFRPLLEAIANQADEQLLANLVESLPTHVLKACDAKHWKLLLGAFPPTVFTTLLTDIPTEQLSDFRETLFALVSAMLSKNNLPAAIDLVPLLLGFPLRTPSHRGQSDFLRSLRTRELSSYSEQYHILIAASHLLKKSTESKKAGTLLLGEQSLTHFREILAPALLAKTHAKYFAKANSLFPELLETTLGVFQEETSRPLEPFSDWSRPCPPLGKEAMRRRYYGSSRKRNPQQELQEFLADPDAESQDFKYAQDIRSELEALIKTHQLDLDYQTVKTGTPHILRCIKNSASHQRALKQRKADLALQAKLEKLGKSS